jgi:ring-1,2-phenylacetyl-CoA epoxidase subunit PaaE
VLKFHPLKVREVRPEAEDAIRVVLDVPAGLRDEFRPAAAQHIVLRVTIDGEEQRRTYSLTGAAGETPLTLGVRVHPQGRVSRHLAQHLRPGAMLEAMPPNGSFGAALAAAPAAAATPAAATAPTSAAAPVAVTGARPAYVAFAAGCGITPVLSIVRTLLEQRTDSQVQLFYGNRHSARTMFLEDLLALKDRYPTRLALHFVMSGEPQDTELYNGRIDGVKVVQFAKTLFSPRDVEAYFVCGPGTMIGDVTDALRTLGVEAARIHAEYFTAGTAQAAGATVSPATSPRRGAAEGMAEVTVLMDGRRRSFTMPIDGETLLDAAARAGIDLPYSCRAGVCSTCRTRLARGQVEMDQNFALEDWELERGFILACQAHPKTAEIELDYDER